MNGGLIRDFTCKPDRIIIQVQGVGCHHDRVATLRIPASNYRLRIGDLVWWNDHTLHWEGKRLLDFKKLHPNRSTQNHLV